MKSVREKKIFEMKPKTHIRHISWLELRELQRHLLFWSKVWGFWLKCYLRSGIQKGRDTLWYKCFISVSWDGLLPEYLLKFCLQWPLICGKIKRALKSQIKEKNQRRYVWMNKEEIIKCSLWLAEKSACLYYLLQFVKSYRSESSEKPQSWASLGVVSRGL